MRRDKQSTGFTIVELLIVVVVIAILASIIVVGYFGITDQARRAAAASHIKELIQKVETVAVNNGGGIPGSLTSVEGATGNDDYVPAGEDYCISSTSGNNTWHMTRYNQDLQEGPCGGGSSNPDPGYPIADSTCFTHSGGTITGYNYDGSTCPAVLTIPSIIEGDTITTIGNASFAGHPMEKVAFPNTVTTIEQLAFPSVSTLTDIYIPDNSVQFIGTAAFVSTGLTSLHLPDSVTGIGDSAFQGAPIATLRMSQGVQIIGSGAFLMTNLGGDLVIPDTIVSIGGSAFSGTGITGLVVGSPGYSGPATFSMGGNCAFCNTSNLVHVYLNGIVASVSGGSFEDSGMRHLHVNPGLTTIGPSAFDLLDNLSTVELPATVTSIGDIAFNTLPSLSSITIADGGSNLTIGYNAFGYGALPSISLPGRTSVIGGSAFFGSGLTTLTIQDGSASLEIGDNAFNGTHLTALTVPGRVTSIGESAFARITELSSVTFNTGLLTINGTAFDRTGLTGTVTIPSSVTSVSYAIFYDVAGNLTINVPAGATVDPNAFDGGLRSHTVIYY